MADRRSTRQKRRLFLPPCSIQLVVPGYFFLFLPVDYSSRFVERVVSNNKPPRKVRTVFSFTDLGTRLAEVPEERTFFLSWKQGHEGDQ